MPDEQLCQVAKLIDAEIGRQRSLLALFADDAEANVGCLDHRDVVAAVSDAAYPLLGMMSDEACDIGFLCRRAPTGDNCRELCRDFDKLVLVVVDTQLKGFSIDDEAAV